MSERNNSPIASVMTTVLVVAVMAFAYVEFKILAGERIVSDLNVSFKEGENFTREFDVTHPNTRHRLKVVPITGGNSPVQDSRYVFAFDMKLVDPTGKTVFEHRDTKATHADRFEAFYPSVKGTHVLEVMPREGDSRADIIIWGNIRQLLVPHLNDLGF